MRFTTTAFFPLIAAATAALLSTTIMASKDGPTRLDMEKRGSAMPCPRNMHRGTGGYCTEDPVPVNACQLVCNTKSPKGQFCPQGTKPIAGEPFALPQPAPAKKEWTINYDGPLTPRRGGDKLYFTGSVDATGDFQMAANGVGLVAESFFIGLTVGDFAYYYSLNGLQKCHTKAPDGKDLYGVTVVTVYDNGVVPG
jgi:hypothetical protein